MLVQFEDWLNSLGGGYTIQKTTNGQVLFAIQNGSMSVAMIRPTFVEAASACLAHVERQAMRSRASA